VAISCSFDAKDGSGAVPTAALSKLDQPNGTAIIGSISISPQSSNPFTAGDWNITYTATATGKTGSFTTTN
jgi:hypothetical protein